MNKTGWISSRDVLGEGHYDHTQPAFSHRKHRLTNMIHHCLKHESTFPAHLTQTEITFPDIKTREYHINMYCSSQGVVMGFHADSGSHDKHCQIFACITFYHSTHEPQTLIFTPLFLFLLPDSPAPPTTPAH